jgi:hypothetical protein
MLALAACLELGAEKAEDYAVQTKLDIFGGA